jgi:tRNA G18 (ribose-2'-O)-methylase SpoU
MFSLFDSKNKKLVKKWKKEHQDLVVYGKKVLAEYVKGHEAESRKMLKKFVNLAMDHLTSEDTEFYKILKNPESDNITLQLIDDFEKSFKDTKMTLMKFLAKYVREENHLDEEFFETFSKIMDVLSTRIDYEESNLYFRLSLS